MADEIVAHCGLVCTNCLAYIATQRDDRELLGKTAERWSSPGHRVEPDDIRCDGCPGTGARLSTFCAMCEVRSCGRERGVENCGLCDDYACDTLVRLWQLTGAKDEAKPVLDRIREGR